jgi:hypothetical protein
LIPLRNKEEIMEKETKVTVAPETEAPKKRGRKAKTAETAAQAQDSTPKTEKKASAEKKAPAKKTASAAKETTEKKTEEKAPAAKKAAPKKAAAKKAAAPEASVVIEYAGRQIVAKDVLAAAEKAYKEAHEGAEIEKIEVYVNTEENCAYYVVNGEPVDDKIQL